MDDTMKLVAGWTIVVAFIFTTIVTCMSLVGWIKFTYKRQQHGLYGALILELVIGTVSSVTGSTTLDAQQVANDLRADGATTELLGIVDEGLATGANTAPVWEREQLSMLIERLDVAPGTPEASQKAALHAQVAKLPSGRISVEAASAIRKSEVIASRRLAPRRMTTLAAPPPE